MQRVTKADLQKLYIPLLNSHKGQNGRLLIIGGSHLFHAASLWALTVASRIVDLVHYASVPENNQIVHEAKSEFRNGIVIHRDQIDEYIEEDDCILIGPGMCRLEESEIPNPIRQLADQISIKSQIQNLNELNSIQSEGLHTYLLTNYLLRKYPHKQWVIDAGALQMMNPDLIPTNAILTPHGGEFLSLLQKAPIHLDHSDMSVTQAPEIDLSQAKINSLSSIAQKFAQSHKCIILLKGVIDIACSETDYRIIEGGNAGMTKGGTGDVLAGLIAALACKNDPFLAAITGSYINKSAGDELYKKIGPYFNSTDLANEIPKVMMKLLHINSIAQAI